MLASIVFLRSTDHLAVLIGSIGHRSPSTGSLFGPEIIIWDPKHATEAQCVTRISLAGLRSGAPSVPDLGEVRSWSGPVLPAQSEVQVRSGF